MSKSARVINRMSQAAKEEDFQEVANEYARHSIQNMREELADDGENGQRERISSEGALSVEVGGKWIPGKTPEPSEYFILLGTGGPASRIRGELSQWKQAETAVFEYQDWFKPWTEARLSVEDQATLLEYAQQFWFGE